MSQILTGQWPTHYEDELIIGSAHNVEVVSDGDDGALICLIASNASWTTTNIYVQRVDKNGFVKWATPIPVYGALQEAITPNTNITMDNNVVSDNHGGMYILFHDQYSYQFLVNYVHLRVHHIDSSGNFLWGDEGKLIATPYDSISTVYTPYGTIISDGEDGIIVAWQKDKNSDVYSEIAVQRYNYDGKELWNSGDVIAIDSSRSIYPQIAIDNNGGVYVYANPVLCRIKNNGTIDWKDSSNFTGDTDIEKMYSDLQSGIFVLGRYFPDINKNVSYPDRYLFCQRLDSTGKEVWNSKTFIDTVNLGKVKYFDACLNMDSSLTFYKFSDTSGCISRVNSKGEFLYKNLPVDSIKAGYHHWICRISPTSDFSNIVTYYDYPNDYFSGNDISAKFYQKMCKIDKHGNALWQDQPIITGIKGFINGITPTDFWGCSQIVNSDNSVIVVNSVEPYQYAVIKRVRHNGQLGSSVSIDANTDIISKDFTLYQNYPNPFNPNTTIAYRLNSSTNVRFHIYDLLGKCIFSEYYEKQSSGYYEFLWSGLDYNGKTVASGIYYFVMTTDYSRKSIKMMLLK